MNHHLLNIALIYFISASAAATISVFVFRTEFLGSFWGALILALIGSFLGGAIGSAFPLVLNRVVQLFIPSILSAFVFLYCFKWLSVLQDY